ncbi:NAD-dependent epimerase/dehydratase family protein [candidate division KSB1 bacterium]|nr:NAD-dependent epimerase/dehydratase family protein [candidate division KSB1 bacterium]
MKESRKEVVLWGTGTPTRDLLYVEDAANSLICALKSESNASPINIGSEKEVSIKELAETIRKVIGEDFELKWDTTKPDGQPRRMLDTSRVEKEIGFKAEVGLNEGLKKTIEWYKKSLSSNDFC